MRSKLVSFCVVFLAVGCGAAPQTDPAAADTAPAAGPQTAADADAPRVLSGDVVEAMDAAGYTYFQLDAGDSTVWAAANQFDVEVGERVTIPLEMPMKNFRSDTLDRTFDLIYFVSVVGREGGAPVGGSEGLELPPGHPRLARFDFEAGESPASPAPGADRGALPVAEVWARRSELAGTEVTIGGLVVKYNANILGKNWLHVQDGTGALEDGTNDLAVTTANPCAVGDVVVATGTLAVDRDFGSGYTYTVILEDATVTK